MGKLRRITSTLLLLGLLSACGASTGTATVGSTAVLASSTVPDATTTTTTTAVATTTPALTTTTLRELTVQEVASVISEHADDLRDGYAAVQDCDLRIDDCSIINQLRATTYVLVVETLRLGLLNAKKRGRLPASLESLVAKTEGAIRTIQTAAGDGTSPTMTCGPGSKSWPDGRADCETLYVMVRMGASSLDTALDGWKVYGA